MAEEQALQFAHHRPGDAHARIGGAGEGETAVDDEQPAPVGLAQGAARERDIAVQPITFDQQIDAHAGGCARALSTAWSSAARPPSLPGSASSRLPLDSGRPRQRVSACECSASADTSLRPRRTAIAAAGSKTGAVAGMAPGQANRGGPPPDAGKVTRAP